MNDLKKRPDLSSYQQHHDSEQRKQNDLPSLIQELNACLLKLEQRKIQLCDAYEELNPSYHLFRKLYDHVPGNEASPKNRDADTLPHAYDAFPFCDSRLSCAGTDSEVASPDKQPNGETPGLCVAREKLRLFSHKTMAILESERQLIAREIHDDLGGSLAAIKFLLEDILSRNGDNPEIAEPLYQTVEYIKNTIKKTKRISAGLRPVILDDLGLKATVRWLCRLLRQSWPGINFVIEMRLDENKIDESQKILVYRIIQEAMTNAARLGRADTIWLYLAQSGDHMELEIRDNGIGHLKDGVSSETSAGEDAFGFSALRQKTEICGGVFSVASYENKGTRLQISLPLSGC